MKKRCECGMLLVQQSPAAIPLSRLWKSDACFKIVLEKARRQERRMLLVQRAPAAIPPPPCFLPLLVAWRGLDLVLGVQGSDRHQQIVQLGVGRMHVRPACAVQVIVRDGLAQLLGPVEDCPETRLF